MRELGCTNKIKFEVQPWCFVPVIFTEAPITEGVVLPLSNRWCAAALLFVTTPLVRMEGDTYCLVVVSA